MVRFYKDQVDLMGQSFTSIGFVMNDLFLEDMPTFGHTFFVSSVNNVNTSMR